MAGHPPETVRLARPDVTLVGDRLGAGPPVLLLHAGGERRQVWAPVQATLAAAGYTTTAFDLRGHGASRPAAAQSLDLFAADVAAMIDRCDAAPVVVGASLGGFAAILADRHSSDRHIAGLVLVDVVPDPSPDRTREWLTGALGPRADNPLVDDILARRDELRRATAGVTAPLLLLRGEHSPLTPADAARLRELVPHARETVLPGAGHLLARDAPDHVATHLLGLLADPRVRARRIETYLRHVGADTVPHPGGDLVTHLGRTAATLTDWGAPAWVVDAAHVHAAYGTDGFPTGLAGATRDIITEVVGARAEGLVERYGSCDRAASYPTFSTLEPTHVHRITGDRTAFTGDHLHAFVDLTVANELDVFAHSPELANRHAGDALRLFRSWSPLLCDGARDAVARYRPEGPR